jgi:phosphoserine aminotransferase
MTSVNGMRTLEEISPIAAEARRLQRLSNDPEINRKQNALFYKGYELHRGILKAVERAGLKVHGVKYPDTESTENDVVEDLSTVDDSKARIQAIVRVPIFTTDQAEKVYSIASKFGCGVMTSGAKTSALGVFQVRPLANLRGLKTVICIEMDAITDPSIDMKDHLLTNGYPIEDNFHPCDLLVLSDETELSENEELILDESRPIALIKRTNGKHSVIVHSTMTVNTVNSFLKRQFSDDPNYRYQIMEDLTSKNDASIGGVIHTSAQGGNRACAKLDLESVHNVQGGESKVLHGEDAKDIVGYNGTAGISTQATFEVTAVPKHEFGFVMPICGKDRSERWKNLLKLQAIMAPYCVHPNTLSPDEESRKLHISSMEILGKSPLDMGFQKYKQSHQAEIDALSPLLEERYSHDTDMYVYVSGSSFHDFTNDGDFDEEKLMSLFSEDLFTSIGLNEEDLFADDDFLALHEDEDTPFHGVMFLHKPEVLRTMDQVRHSAPEMARMTANSLGGQTFSTDFNVRFTSLDEGLNTKARETIASIYADYVTLFDDGPFQVDVYGHLYPGMVVSPLGGGMDPHIRVTLKLNDPGTRYNAPELVNFIKKSRAKLYKDLLALDGKDGVVVAPPEKSHLTNAEYVKDFRLYHPDKVRHMEKVILGDDRSLYTERMRDGFRVPFEMPKEPSLGMKRLLPADLIDPEADPSHIEAYYDAILHMAQYSHRSPQVKAIFREATVKIRESLQLNPYDQYVFFIESPQEGRDILRRNYLNTKNVCDYSQMDSERVVEVLGRALDPHSVHLIPAELLGGMSGLTLMITPRELILEADKKQKGGAQVPGHKNLIDMASRAPYETPETPFIVGVAHLAVTLQLDSMGDQDFGNFNASGFISANPGPVMMNSSVGSEDSSNKFLHNISESDFDVIESDLRTFLKIPDSIDLAYTGSATQCMQHLAAAICEKEQGRTLDDMGIQVIQVTNGAFSERFLSILQSESVDVAHYNTPWTTAETSQMDFLIDHFVREIESAKKNNRLPLLSLTAHKTSTSAHFHPDVVVNALNQRGLVAGDDYELLLDLTSGLGAIDYFESQDHQGLSFFGGVQKALACPSGLGIVGLSPKLKRMLCDDIGGGDFSLAGCYSDASEKRVHNPFVFDSLGSKLASECNKERNVGDVNVECRRKMTTVLGYLFLHPELERQVTDPRDQSPLEVGVYSIERNIPEAIAMMEILANMVLGSGYGPFSKEAFRLYLASLDSTQLDDLLVMFNRVKEMPEVKYTVNKRAPLVSLREPHDPLMTLKTLVTGMERGLEVDDILKTSLALNWIWRLKYTFEKGKNTIYGTEKNIHEIGAILETRLWPQEGRSTGSLIEIYMEVRSDMDTLRRYLLSGNDIEINLLDGFVKNIFRRLSTIVLILEKYADNAPKTVEGRVEWPLTATPEQLNGNGS